MSEQDINTLQTAILQAIREQELERESHAPKENWFVLGIMAVMLSVVVFIGNTVWNNSIAISKITEQLHALQEDIKGGFSDKEGTNLVTRVVDLEKEQHKTVATVNSLQGILNTHAVKMELGFNSFKENHHVVHENIDKRLDKIDERHDNEHPR